MIDGAGARLAGREARRRRGFLPRGAAIVGAEHRRTEVPLARLREDEKFATLCLETAETLKETIESQAWDGKWYRRAYFDDGQPLGSQENTECQIDSLPQSWSVISGAGHPERAQQPHALHFVPGPRRSVLDRRGKDPELDSKDPDLTRDDTGRLRRLWRRATGNGTGTDERDDDDDGGADENQ